MKFSELNNFINLIGASLNDAKSQVNCRVTKADIVYALTLIGMNVITDGFEDALEYEEYAKIQQEIFDINSGEILSNPDNQQYNDLI